MMRGETLVGLGMGGVPLLLLMVASLLWLVDESFCNLCLHPAGASFSKDLSFCTKLSLQAF